MDIKAWFRIAWAYVSSVVADVPSFEDMEQVTLAAGYLYHIDIDEWAIYVKVIDEDPQYVCLRTSPMPSSTCGNWNIRLLPAVPGYQDTATQIFGFSLRSLTDYLGPRTNGFRRATLCVE